MTRQNKILLLSVLLLLISAGTVLFMSVKTARVPFISTTGFYIHGIDSDDPELISSWGQYKNSDEHLYIHCFQQYRSTEDYIYDYWRRDMFFYFKADRVFLEMPDSIWAKVDFVWFKTGNKVLKYDKTNMENEWETERSPGKIMFVSGQNQISGNTIYDGFKSFWNSSAELGINNKFPVSILFVLLLGMIIYSLSEKIKYVLNLILKKLRSYVNKHKNFFSGVFSVFAGLITVFIFLEISLRIIGYFHEKQNINKNYSIAKDADKLIVCLGDSFTEGFGSGFGNDYPAVLNRMVKEEFGQDYQVVNFGQSGKNTTQIKDEFLNYLEIKTPEVVVLMAGSANYWNYYGFENKTGFIYNIRTFKLIKLLWNQIFSEKAEKRIHGNTDYFSEAEYLENRNEFQQSDMIKTLNSHPADSLEKFTDRDLIYYSILTNTTQDFTTDFRNSQDSDLQQLLIIHDLYKGVPVDFNLLSSGYYKALYFYLCSTKKDSFHKKRYLFMALREYPYLEDAYYGLVAGSNSFLPLLKSDYSENRVCIADTVTYYKIKFGFVQPGVKTGKVFINESTDLDIEKSKINRWVEDDLEEIIVACRKKGVQLIIMTYPYKYKNPLYAPVNDVLYGLGKRYNIPEVDNFSAFDKITEDRDSYFVADGHCSDKGYRYIAEQIFEVIKSEKMLKDTDAE